MNIEQMGSFNYNHSSPSLKPSPNASNKELMKVSQEFESIFISQLFKEMKKSVQSLNKDSSLFKSSMGEDIFQDMLVDQYAQNSASSSPLGLAKMVYESLERGRKYETHA